MPLLNEPIGFDDQGGDDWTPEKGLVRGLRAGAIAAAMIAVGLAPISLFLPYFVLPWMLRSAMAFGVAWVLLLVIRRAAGMVGFHVTALALALTFAVLVTQHFIFAIWGVPSAGEMLESWWLFPAVLVERVVPERGGRLIGWRWLHPYAVFAVNIIPFPLGAGFFALIHGRD